jgi:tetratricopeptide (TPR) repeat protein
MSADLKETAVPLAEISQGPNAFEAFLDRNQKGIVALAILLAIAAAGVVIYRGIEHGRQESAGADLVKASDAAAYQAVADSHQGTAAGGSAMILLSNSQWTEGKKDDSIATLRKFIETYPEHPAIPNAKASLGSKLMAQGKYGDASKIFDEIVADPKAEFIAPFALISLGDIARAEGDLEKAGKSYEQVKNQFPESNFTDSANRRAATLKAKPPVEVEAPPAPPAAEPGSAPSAPPSLSVTPQGTSPAVEIPVEPAAPTPDGAPEEPPCLKK